MTLTMRRVGRHSMSSWSWVRIFLLRMVMSKAGYVFPWLYDTSKEELWQMRYWDWERRVVEEYPERTFHLLSLLSCDPCLKGPLLFSPNSMGKHSRPACAGLHGYLSFLYFSLFIGLVFLENFIIVVHATHRQHLLLFANVWQTSV